MEELTVLPVAEDRRRLGDEPFDKVFYQFEVGALWAIKLVHTRVGSIEAMAGKAMETGGLFGDKLYSISR